MIWIELILFLACIVIGARIGGIGLGTVGAIGLVVFVFVFALPPGSPPVIVLGMIISVITALAAMEAAGGIDFLVSVAEKILKSRPKSITFLAPIVTYVLIMLAGTQHVIYALLPVIAEISRKSNIRPEKPISMTIIAGMSGIVASPIAAATVAVVGLLGDRGVTLPMVMMISIPSTFLSILIGCAVVSRMGKPLDQDPEYLKRLESGEIKPPEEVKHLSGEEFKRARLATILFLSAVALVVILGLFPDLRPVYSQFVDGSMIEGRVNMGAAIMIIMLAMAGVIMLVCKSGAKETVGGSIMKSGIVAVISILGISWLGSSFFEGNRVEIVDGISGLIQGNSWVFAIGLFLLSILLFSQAATVVTLYPVGLALGIPTEVLIAVYPAVNGLFFLPTYGTILAAVSFDQTGTTKIGKYLLNHSFMIPGLVTISSAVIIGLILSQILL